MSASNVGKWDGWYGGIDPKNPGAFRYGETVTYLMAAAFMVDVGTVEDWGCGAGGFKRFYRGNYIGVDGSKTPIADKVVDLCMYTSSVDGIVMRHVLEHNYDWDKILDNAIASFRKKLCLILFTPFVDATHEIAHNREHGIDAPDMAFSRADIEMRFDRAAIWGQRRELYADIPTATGYGVEHVYFIWR
jgi:hypothetical protein